MELVGLKADGVPFSIIMRKTLSVLLIRNCTLLLYMSQKTFSSGTRFVINTSMNNQLQSISAFTNT